MKQLTVLLLSFFFLGVQAQKSNDAQLDSRLQQYFSLNKKLDFEKLMDYTHPRLFTVAPKEAIIEAMSQMFSNPEIKFSIDSISVLSVGPVYKYGKESYRKIGYFMGMTMTLSDSIDLKEERVANIMMQSMQKGFPGKKVTINPESNSIMIRGNEIMFAIKDPASTDWMFLGYDKAKPEMFRSLYPKPVRQYYKLL